MARFHVFYGGRYLRNFRSWAPAHWYVIDSPPQADLDASAHLFGPLPDREGVNWYQILETQEGEPVNLWVYTGITPRLIASNRPSPAAPDHGAAAPPRT